MLKHVQAKALGRRTTAAASKAGDIGQRGDGDGWRWMEGRVRECKREHFS